MLGFARWKDLTARATLLDALESFLLSEDLAPTRGDDGLYVRLDIDGLELVQVVSVQGTLVLCTCLLSEPVSESRLDAVARYFVRANTVQQFACLSLTRENQPYARTVLETDGIPVTPRALNQVVYASQLLASRFLPYAVEVARGEADGEQAAKQAQVAWQTFVEACERE